MNRISIFGKGWNFSQDGPGNRLIYHFQGCNLSCPWCSNPEGIDRAGTLLVCPDKLKDAVCPHGAIQNKTLDRSHCQTCTGRTCLGKYRNEGIRFSAKEYTIEELADEIEGARTLFHSGGGVTCTGGEATLQFDPLKQLLIAAKRMGIHTAIETNGTNNRLPELFSLIDTLMIDFKHPDSSTHRRILGVGNETVIRNIEKASTSCSEIWIRIPLIPSFNDAEEDIGKFIHTLKGINLERVSVELLPYHEYGKIKWEQVGMPYTPSGNTLSPNTLRQYEQLFRANNITIINT